MGAVLGWLVNDRDSCGFLNIKNQFKRMIKRLKPRRQTAQTSQRQSFLLCKCCVCACSVVSHSVTSWIAACQAPWPRDFPGKNTGVGCHFLLQGNLPDQRANPHFLHLLHWQANSLSLSPIYECLLGRFSHVRLFVTPWTAAHQAPLSM